MTAYNQGGAFLLGANYRPTGVWNFSQTPTVNGVALGTGTGSSLLHQATATLTNAQIKALKATPVTIVAGVSGTIYIPLSVSFYLKVTTPYTNAGGGHVTVFVAPSLGAASFEVQTTTSFITATQDDLYFNAASIISDDFVTNITGKDIAVGNDGASEFAAGDAANSLILAVAYYSVSTATGAFL